MHQPRGVIQNGKRFFGYHPDKRRDRDARMHVGALLAHFGAQVIPGVGNLSAFRVPIYDQGQTGSCFPAGTPILLADGTERSIEDVAVGNEVMTHNGMCRPVTKVFQRSYEDELYSVRLHGFGYATTMTREHPVCVVRNALTKKRAGRIHEPFEAGDIEWVAACDLKPGDFVLMPANTRPEEPCGTQYLRTADYIERDIWEGEGVVRIMEARRPSTIPSRFVVDERFATLVGLFLAEGSYRKNDGLLGGLNFTFARHEDEYQQYVVEALKAIFGVDASIEKEDSRPSVADVRINNATLAELFYGLCGEGALYKRVPKVFYSASRSVRLALLRGWMQGDGAQDPLPVYKRSVQADGTTSSKALHRGMMRIALLSGLKPGASIRNQEEHQNAPPRELYFYGNDVFEIFPDKREKVAQRGVEPNGKTKNYRRHDLGFICRIQSIEVSEVEQPIEVYNLEVEGEHTYVANFMAVHNCGGHGSAQLDAIAFGAAGMSLGWVPSPGHIYGNTRIEELTSASQLLTDSGIAPADLITAQQLYGIRPMSTTPGLVNGLSPDGRQSDVWGPADVANLAGVAANVNDKPDQQEEEQGVANIVVGEYTIPVGVAGTGGTDDNMASTISIVKRPVGVGLFVDSAVMQWTAGSTPIDSINLNDPNGGGHWVACDCYSIMEVNGLSQRVYEIPNSWGVTYGQNGVVLITARALSQSMSDCIAWTCRKGAAAAKKGN